MSDDHECSEEFDIVANQFRNGVFKLFDDANGVTLFYEMPAREKIESFVAGVFSAVVAICFGVTDGRRDEIMKYLTQCLVCSRGVVESGEPDDE